MRSSRAGIAELPDGRLPLSDRVRLVGHPGGIQVDLSTPSRRTALRLGRQIRGRMDFPTESNPLVLRQCGAMVNWVGVDSIHRRDSAFHTPIGSVFEAFADQLCGLGFRSMRLRVLLDYF